MNKMGMWIAALGVAWLGLGAVAEAQYCQGNVDCGEGWSCVGGQCVQAGVTVQGQVGGAGVSGSVTVQGGAQPQPQPQPQQQVYVQQPQQPVYYAQPQPQQPVRYVNRPIWGLIGSGIGLLAGGYVVDIIVTGIGALFIAAEDAFGTDTATLADEFFYTGLIPVAGPWIQLGITQTNGYDGWAPFLIIDGLLQVSGLTMIVLGAALPNREAVYADLGDGVELAFTPTIGGFQSTLTF